MPELPAEPTDIEPPPKTADKLDIMSRNCSELKSALAQLQAQMNGLNNVEKEKPAIVEASVPTSAAASANKKAKNKKNKAKPSCPHKERAVHAEMVATIKSVFAPTDSKVVTDTIVSDPTVVSDIFAADSTATDSTAAEHTATDPNAAGPTAADPTSTDHTAAEPTSVPTALENPLNRFETNGTEVRANEIDSPVDVVAMTSKPIEQNKTNNEASIENSAKFLTDVSVTG